ncbi:MAG: hypothetical protein IT348_19760, partial [Candidatus Eisenbacteria bacterium]|nr:hypothetical protein [Candidatus Eisenbacteria bacterium]
RAAGTQAFPNVVSDGAGGAIVVWQDDRSGTLADADVYAQKLDATGSPQWTTDGVEVCTAAGDQNYPLVVTDGAGGAIVTWQDLRGADADVYVQRIGASGVAQWAAQGEALCLAPLDQYNPALAADGAGGAIVAWQDLRGGASTDIYAQRVSAGGTALWAGGGVALCAATGAQVCPAVTSDGLGGAVVAWEDARAGINDDIYAQRINGAGAVRWAADGVAVCAAGNYQVVPGIVPDGASGAIVAWTDSRAATHQDVYAQRMDSSGVAQWAANGVAACAAAGNQGSPVLDADGAGGVALAWYDYRAGATPDLYAQRLSGAGAAQWAANGVAVCTAAGLQSSPAISADGTGGAVASWLDYRSRIEQDVYAQRITGAGAAAWTADGVAVRAQGVQHAPATVAGSGGATIVAWQEKRGGQYDILARAFSSSGAPLWPATVLCAAGDAQSLPVIASDGAGGAIVAWQDQRSGTDFTDVYAQRVNAAGAVRWAANGVVVSRAIRSQTAPAIVADGSGGAIVAWPDDRSGVNDDLYMQRVDSAGVALWTAEGEALCTEEGNQSGPVLTTDGAGGAIVVWQDLRGGFTSRVYAQRVNGAGLPQWAAGGIELTTSSGSQQSPALAADGLGGAVAAWADRRSGTSDDVYAQRVDAAGARLWNAGGAAVGTGTGDQSAPALFSDGAGAALFAWRDGRGADDDVYAQSVDSNGVAQWTAGGVAVCAATDDQLAPVVLTDGGGGLVAVWSDRRNGTDLDLYAQRLDENGAAQWAADGVALADTAWNQSDASAISDGAGGMVAVWADRRDGRQYWLYTQRLSAAGTPQWNPDGVTPTWLALSSFEAAPEYARLEWFAAAAAYAEGVVERREPDGEWSELGVAPATSDGRFTFVDRTVAAGARYAYRLGVAQEGVMRWSAESWLDVPVRTRLALAGTWPNPVTNELRVSFSLAGLGAARLELLDVAGRFVKAWPLAGARAGAHVRTLERDGALAPGVYLLRLTEGRASVARRVTLVR